jgi:hypothetical protein
MGQEQSTQTKQPVTTKPILKNTQTINIKPVQKDNDVYTILDSNDMNPHKKQINKGINDYYNFNVVDNIHKSNIPKLYENSKDDNRFNRNLEDELSKQLFDRNLSTPSKINVCHELPSPNPSYVNTVYNPTPTVPINNYGQTQFIPGQLYVPDKQILQNNQNNDYYIEMNRDDINIQPPTQPFQSINTRDNTFAPEAPSFTYIPPPTSQQLPKYTQNLNYQSQENNNNIKEDEPIAISSLIGFTNLEKQLLVSKDINSLDIDPFGLLNKNRSITLNQLYECYKKLRLKNHPDKGGDNNNFNKIIKCMKKIEEIEKMKISDKQFNTLKDDFNKESSKYEQPYIPQFHENNNENNNFNKKFNQFFEQNKYTGDQDIGYGDLMDKGPYQKDIEVKNTIGAFDRSNFNNVFTQSKKKPSNKVVVYKVPEPVYGNVTFAQSLVSKDNNYTQHGVFTDYMEAFTESNVLIDTEQVKINENIKLEEALKKHKNASLTLTNEQVLAIEEYDNNLKYRDNKEVDYYKNYSKEIDKYANQMKTISFRPPESTR